MSAPAVSIVVSTYEYPGALDAVLRALSDQSESDFEVVVADDGSGPETEALVNAWLRSFGDDRLRHVRQPHEGFRVARVRNLGALVARGAYLAFLDGDCVPRRHLVRALLRSVHPSWFACTYRFDLSPALTRSILDGELPVHRWSLVTWARRLGREEGSLAWLTPRDRRRVGRSGTPGFAPPLNNYGFLHVSRADFERANGYDARYEGWGAEDTDLGMRLLRLGLRCGWPGPQATLFHLWHESRKDRTRAYKPKLQETRSGSRAEAIVGVRELAVELGLGQVSANRVGASSLSSDPENR